MQQEEKIKVLVIPDLFPKYNGDLQGVFIPDHLIATAHQCNNQIFFFRLWAGKSNINSGIHAEQAFNSEIVRYYLLDHPVNVYAKPFRYLQLFIKAYRVAKCLEKPGLIHAHGTILSGTMAFLLSRKWKVPFVITEHQGPFSVISNRPLFLSWCRFIMQRANLVLTVSEHLKQEILSAGIRPERIEVSYNPVNTHLFKLRINPSQKKILFAGRLDEFKGALRCLKAFDGIAQNYSEWTFTILGDGEEMPAIKQFLKENRELNAQVRLIGAYTKEQFAEELMTAAFFVFPSRHESFGLVVAEALSCGVPVITSNCTALKELVNERSGRLVQPDSIEQIQEAMQHMMLNYSSFDSAEIRQNCITNYSSESFGNRTVEIYRSLLRNHPN